VFLEYLEVINSSELSDGYQPVRQFKVKLVILMQFKIFMVNKDTVS
jgi:hypothetical protein